MKDNKYFTFSKKELKQIIHLINTKGFAEVQFICEDKNVDIATFKTEDLPELRQRFRVMAKNNTIIELIKTLPRDLQIDFMRTSFYALYKQRARHKTSGIKECATQVIFDDDVPLPENTKKLRKNS